MLTYAVCRRMPTYAGVAANCHEGVLLLKAAAERGRWSVLLRDALEAYMRGDMGAAIRSYQVQP